MSDSALSRDERLAALLDGLSRRRRNGEQPDIDAAVVEHPDLADELRQLWAAAQVADVISRTRTLPPRKIDASAIREAVVPDLNDYEIQSELGRGGMGVVYLARQISLNRPVALKMVLRGDLAGEADRARFRAEAEAAARLEHFQFH